MNAMIQCSAAATTAKKPFTKYDKQDWLVFRYISTARLLAGELRGAAFTKKLVSIFGPNVLDEDGRFCADPVEAMKLGQFSGEIAARVGGQHGA